MRAVQQRLRRMGATPVAQIVSDALPAWLFSLTLHVAALVVISLLTFAVPLPFELTLTISEEPELLMPDELHFQDDVTDPLGALSTDGVGVAMAATPELIEFTQVVEPEPDLQDVGEVQFVEEMQHAANPLVTSTKLVRGIAGLGVTGAEGAIDRMTHEILLSLEDRDTLVVWLFDQSGSLARQRQEINDRLARIYQELGLIRDDLRDSESNHNPLLTAVLAFGSGPTWMIRKPTADVQSIQDAVSAIQLDESGIENVFSSIYLAATEFRPWRSKRNIMLIAITDEVGDDHQSMLEKCVGVCRKYTMPVYVLGVPAAFGESETLLKWVDPDPKYNQTPRWGRVNQGPESLRPERLQLPFTGGRDTALDSGFGPFALTRLCYQTGGIYFAIHPNREPGRRIGRRETEAFSSHFSYFFDPQRMRPYRPEYVSLPEYDRRARSSPLRSAVLRTAQMTLNRLENPRVQFIKSDESQFSGDLTEAQKLAAKLEPKLNSLYEVLMQGEDGRSEEESLRWQAAYDLACGQTLAVMVRTRAYNEMLAKAKRGLTTTQPNHNTWRLVPDPELSTSSRLARQAEQARDHLRRVAEEHQGTPWALLAKHELGLPLGWRWQDSYTPLPGNNGNRNAANNANQRNVPRDDQKRMLPDRPAIRAVPKL